VLKDAAASAIYGARASNGVVVITTKKANSEKLSVEFNSDLTLSNKYNH
jgi:TonB-dependent SusC/RagA subfamily outer membrane receptor